MIIKATDEQILEMGKRAIMASCPMGMGYLHYDNLLKKEDITDLEVDPYGLNIDYYQGRMVKFHARRVEGGFDVQDFIRSDYQSWINKYQSYEDLLMDVLTEPEVK